MVDLPPEFRTKPLGYYVWSRSPRAGHVLAFAIARFVDPAFRWISIRESPETPSEEERWVHRLLPRNRILDPLVGSELGKARRVPRQTFNALIRPEGAASERIALDHFLLLPDRLQAILDETNPVSTPRAVVVSNTNRVREFYPADPERLRAYTDVFPRSGISMITTSIPPPYRGRYGFDVVLRLDIANAAEWRKAHLVVEKGLRSGEFRTGVTLPTDQLPWYLEMGTTVEKTPG
jgi:hypothetical protein